MRNVDSANANKAATVIATQIAVKRALKLVNMTMHCPCFYCGESKGGNWKATKKAWLYGVQLLD